MSAFRNEKATSTTSVTDLLNWKVLEKKCRTYFSAMESSVSEFEQTMYVIPSHLLEVLEKYCGSYDSMMGPTFWRAVAVRNYNSHHVDAVRILLSKFRSIDFQQQFPNGESRLLKMLQIMEEALPTASRDPEGYMSRIINATHKYLIKHKDKLTEAERASLLADQPALANSDLHLEMD